MKKDKDIWSKKLSQKMQDFEEPVSDDLWQRIENDLPKQSRKPVIFYISRIAAIAACLGLAIWGYFILNDNDVKNTHQATIAQTDQPQQEAVEHDNTSIQINASDLLEKKEEAIAMNVSPEKKTEHESTIPTEKENTPAIVAEKETKEEPAKTDFPTNPNEGEKATETQENVQNPFNLFDNSPKPQKQERPSLPQVKTAKNPRWDIAMSVNSGSNHGDRSGSGFSPLDDFASLGTHKLTNTRTGNFYDEYKKVLVSNLSKATRTNFEYHLPLTYSAIFRYRINSRWGINAGLNFTQYKTDWNSGTETDYYESEQKAFFIGLPINANFTIFDSRYFSMYALAGGSVEKCVAGNVKHTVISSHNKVETPSITDGLDAHPWQFSLNAGVGLQLNINKNYGIFAEPQVAKYFYDKDLHVRKTNRPEFRLNIGLRFSY